MRRIFLVLVLAVLVGGTAEAQVAPDSGTFVVRLGTDTLAVEQYVRRGDTLQVRAVSRSPRTMLRDYTLTLGPNGGIQSLEARTLRPGDPADAAPVSRMGATRSGDSIRWEWAQGDTREQGSVAATIPVFPLAFQLYTPYQLATIRARAAAADTLTVHFQSAGEVFPSVVRRVGADSVMLTGQFGIPFQARVDEQGRILRLSAAGGTTVERVEWRDLDALAREFVARDEAGTGLGPLSPRDTVHAAVGGANVMVDYSRPAKRGRVVFGGIVPWNEVWRTGANQATQLVTDRPLRIGETTVPAGSYTLFTIPAQDGWTLIINRQTGQAGTDYNPAQDLARVPMRVERLAEPVERFTIQVRPEQDGGALVLEWDDVRAVAPFRVLPAGQ